jgi:hypothetical protein
MADGDDRRQQRNRSLESAEEARRRLEDGEREHPRDRALEDGHIPVDEANLDDVRRFLRRHDRDLARRDDRA